MSHKKDFIKDTFLYGLGSGIRKFIAIFLLPFYTRALTPDDYGVLSSVSTFAMLFSAFIDLGLDSATSYFFLTNKNEKEKGSILFTLLVLRLFTFIPSLILTLFSSQISAILFGTTEYTWVVFLTCLTMPFTFLVSEQTYIYRYFRQPMKYNHITIIQSIISIGLGISLVVILKYGIIGARLATLVSTAIILPFTFLTFTRKKYVYKFSMQWTKKLLRFGYPLVGAAIATWIFQSSDRFFLLHYSNLKEIGWYSIGQTFSQPLLILNTAVQMSFGVLFLKVYNEDTNYEKKNSKKMAIDSFNLYLVASISISLFLSIFSLELLNFITTKEYLQGALAIPFMCFSLVCSQAYQTMGPGITLAEKNYHYTWITIVTAVINVILNFLLIPSLGFVGAAIATLISFIVYWLVKFYVSQRYFYINYKVKRILAYFLICLIISLIVPLSYFYYELHIKFILKLFLFMIGLLLPGFLNILKLTAIRSYVSYIRNKISLKLLKK